MVLHAVKLAHRDELCHVAPLRQGRFWPVCPRSDEAESNVAASVPVSQLDSRDVETPAPPGDPEPNVPVTTTEILGLPEGTRLCPDCMGLLSCEDAAWLRNYWSGPED